MTESCHPTIMEEKFEYKRRKAGLQMNYQNATPKEVRALIRKELWTGPTSGMCGGYAQANLVILPKTYADDFARFSQANPKPCPVLEMTPPGDPMVREVATADLRTDLPRYFVYRNGVRTEERLNIVDLWQDDFVGFLIGCSFSFEEALLQAGIEIRHISMGRNVPMYKTNLPTRGVGPFFGPTVVSMRPMTPENAQRAAEITAKFPKVHGGPIQIGNPQEIGILDLQHPDYGDAVLVKPDEIPVFWACGVTPQAVIEQAKLPLVITHAPGHMFITDRFNIDFASK